MTNRNMKQIEKFNPEMLTLARELRKMSQVQLAKQARVSQGRISKIENRLGSPDEPLVNTLSDVLDVPESFFFQQAPIHGLPISYFRKRASISKKELSAIVAELNVRKLHIDKLLKSVEINQERDIPRFEPDEFADDIPAIAQAVRSAWHLSDGPIGDLVDLIEAAGCIVVPCDFGPKIDAISQWIPGSCPMIFFNQSKPMDRLRFSLSHELGHLVMHSKAPHIEMEAQADAFASEFLMPESGIKTKIPRNLTLTALAALKPVWGVSMAAVLYRAKALGRITDRQYSYLWMQMGMAGYRNKEPPELDVPPEKPSILTEILSSHQSKLGYTDTELAVMLHTGTEEFRHWYTEPKARRHLKVVK